MRHKNKFILALIICTPTAQYTVKTDKPYRTPYVCAPSTKVLSTFFFILYIDVQTQKYNLKGKYEKIDVIIMTQDWQP